MECAYIEGNSLCVKSYLRPYGVQVCGWSRGDSRDHLLLFTLPTYSKPSTLRKAKNLSFSSAPVIFSGS